MTRGRAAGAARTGLGAVGALVLMVAVAACHAGPQETPDPRPAAMSPAGPLVYVAAQDAAEVTVVDAGSLDVVATVDLEALGYGANPKPHHIAVEPDGEHWYVSLIGANRVLKLDRSNRVVAEAEVEVPGMLALDASSERLMVGRSMSAVNPPPRVAIIDRDDMAVEEISVLFPRPHALTTHPTRPIVYGASLAENRMAVIRPEEEAVEVHEIPAAEPAHGHGVHTLVQWAVSPDGRTMVGTGEMSAAVLIYDLADPLRPAYVCAISVDPRPWHPVFSPDGRELWFASKGGNSVTVVDTDDWSVAAVIRHEALAEPHGAAISADGRYVFVASNNLRGEYTGAAGALVVIERASREVVRVIATGANATGVGTNARR